jgi:large subunit ribosomal protein L35
MPKLKTKSAAKKRFKVTGTGKVVSKAAFTRHMMKNKSQKMKRKARGTHVMFKTDGEKILINWMPYLRTKMRKAKNRVINALKRTTTKA